MKHINNHACSLIALLLLAATSLPLAAQDADERNFLAPEAEFMVLSANGKYTGYSNEAGIMVIVNTATQETIDYTDYTLNPYLGYARSISNDGVAVGSVLRGSKEVPCYFKNGEVYDLPVPENVSSMAYCDGISSDGKYIVGQGLYGGAMDGSGSFPLLWTLQGDGNYTVEILPHSPNDPTGSPAQNVSAFDISADGNTILGHKIPYDPYATYLIVWRKTNGVWQCDESLASYAWDLEACKNIPEYPGEQPVKPNLEDYLTPEEAAAYNEAYAKYKYDFNRYIKGEIKSHEVSPVPYLDDYAVVNREQYDADYKVWRPLYEKYMALWRVWSEAYVAAETKCYFEMNMEHISPNGKHIIATVSYPSSKSANSKETLDGREVYIYNYASIDVDDNMKIYSSDIKRSLSTGVDDNGVAFFVVYDNLQNMQGYAATKPGESIPLVDYIRQLNSDAADWIDSNLRFTGTATKYDSNGDPVIGLDGEIATVDVYNYLVSGAAFPSADGRKFACLAKQNVDLLTSGNFSYFVDTTDIADAIASPEYANTGEADIQVFSIDGRKLTQPQHGINIVKKNGRVVKMVK